MSRNRQHSRKRQKHLMTAALLLCLAVLGFSVWLLFVPNTQSVPENPPPCRTALPDSSNAAGINALDTPSNIDAPAFLAVLEGSTAQLPQQTAAGTAATLPLQKWTAMEPLPA
ncbi:MAG: hypothetical protein ACLR5S_03070 [Ruminococcus sp.]